MICPDCNGARYAIVRGRLVPCATCGDCGIASCCDGAVGCSLDVVNGELAAQVAAADPLVWETALRGYIGAGTG